jgi:hypothetical protein
MSCHRDKLPKNTTGKYKCKKCGVLSDKKKQLCKPQKSKE